MLKTTFLGATTHFFFYVVKSLHDGYNSARKLFQGIINARYIRILFFSIRSNYTLNISVVYRITDIFVIGVATSDRTINNYCNRFTYSLLLFFL